jgi:hypothetical protein
MRRIAWLFLVVLGSVILVQAQNSTHTMELSGTVCRSTCVTKVNNVSTCDSSCTDKSGAAVLVDDQGNVRQVANQNMCTSHMGKHVKMTAVPMEMAVPTESEREQTLRIMTLTEDAGGGL